MVGYADDHYGDTYCMYDPTTGMVRNTRDVVWAEWKRVNPKETMKVFEEQNNSRIKTTIGLDDEEVIKYDDDNKELEKNPKTIIANNLAAPGRNATNGLVGRNTVAVLAPI